MSARIWLVRHARPASAWGGADDDPGLDEAGVKQAEAVARRLAPEGPRAIISSPLRRCRETAAPLGRALGMAVEIEPAVGEIPTPAGLVPEARGAWLARAMAGTWAGIEGDRDYLAWRSEVLAAVRARPGCAIFSHFIAINGVLSALAGSEAVAAFRPDHAGITVLEADEAGLRVLQCGSQATTEVL